MTYGSTILADNPVHYWRLAAPGGTFERDIGSTRVDMIQQDQSQKANSEHYSGPASDGASVFCVPKGFNAHNTPSIHTPCSAEIWSYCINTSSQGADNELLALNRSGTTDNFELTESIVSGTIVYTARSRGIIASAGGFSRFHWHHIVVTDDATDLKLYVDAINVDTQVAASSGVWNSGEGLIGCTSSSAIQSASSALAEAAFYSSALSPSQINNHFLAADTASFAPVFAGTAGSDLTLLSQILTAVQFTFPPTT